MSLLSSCHAAPVATNSSHYVQIEEPQLVIDAIGQVIEAVRAEKSPR